MNYVITIVLILFSALFSGLTLGLMSLGTQELKRKKSLGDKRAAKVYEVRKDGNLLLCTLLIGNVAVNSSLSVFLGSIASGWMATLVATSLIVVFGEILPQAVFSRFALSVGAKTAWLVKIFIFIFYPACKPLAWVLDKTLGGELITIYSKKELMKIIEEHEDAAESDVDEDEEKIIRGALTFSDKTVREVMTPKSVVVSLDSSEEITEKVIDRIQEDGQSRLPVYKNNIDNIVGILNVKRLLGAECIGKTAGQLADKKVYFVGEDKKLDDVFGAFLHSHQHLFIVVGEFRDVVGVVTLEDVIEEIIDDEIMDEDDRHKDLQKVAKRQKKERLMV